MIVIVQSSAVWISKHLGRPSTKSQLAILVRVSARPRVGAGSLAAGSLWSPACSPSRSAPWLSLGMSCSSALWSRSSRLQSQRQRFVRSSRLAPALRISRPATWSRTGGCARLCKMGGSGGIFSRNQARRWLRRRANDAHAAEAALCVVRGVDQRPQGKEEQEDRRCK